MFSYRLLRNIRIDTKIIQIIQKCYEENLFLAAILKNSCHLGFLKANRADLTEYLRRTTPPKVMLVSKCAPLFYHLPHYYTLITMNG